MNLAVPIHGVPVGLSLLGSDAASGSVSIQGAATLGVDILSLHAQVSTWARSNATFLEAYAPGPRATNYLRVVSRIYATREVDVELRDASSRSAGLDVGAAKPVNLLFPELPNGRSNVNATVVTNFTNGWNALTNILNASSPAGSLLPGGSLRLTGASARTVSLQETLDPPLLLGYLGFDCEILERGRPGPPMPTYAHLDTKSRLHHARVTTYHQELQAQVDAYHHIREAYARAAGPGRGEIRRAAQRLRLMSNADPDEWETALNLQINGNDPARTRLFEQLHTFVTTTQH
jgi:hypothetical protein